MPPREAAQAVDPCLVQCHRRLIFRVKPRALAGAAHYRSGLETLPERYFHTRAHSQRYLMLLNAILSKISSTVQKTLQ